MQKGAKSKYGADHDIRAKIDPRTGELELKRNLGRERWDRREHAHFDIHTLAARCLDDTCGVAREVAEVAAERRRHAKVGARPARDYHALEFEDLAAEQVGQE